MPQLIDALTADPAQLLRSALRIFHFIGLALGLGAATLLDMMVLRFFLGRKMTEASFQIFLFLSHFVTAGLAILWISGAGFLLFYWANDPVLLTNHKVWAKIAIVAILTINGLFIHKLAMPFMKQQLGKKMFDGVSAKRQSAFIVVANVSLVSWYAPVFIANLPHLNFQVPMPQILAGYALGLGVVIAISHIVLFGRRSVSQHEDVAQQRQDDIVA